MCSDLELWDQNTARTMLELLFRSIKFPDREVMPLRGHNHRHCVLWQLMLKRTHLLPRAREWLLGRDNRMSDTIQDEILEMFAHAVQREIISETRHCSLFVHSHSRWSCRHQSFSCCLQFVDTSLTAQSMFPRFYSAPDTSAETLFSCIKDIFHHLTIPLERLHMYCFDGASNMSGRWSVTVFFCNT